MQFFERLAGDVLAEPLAVVDGAIAVPEGPGFRRHHRRSEARALPDEGGLNRARVIPPTTRSLLVLEMAAELTARAPARSPVRQATAIVDLGGGHRIALFGSSTIAGINAVAAREVALAIINPSAALTLAYRGTGPFDVPLPLRTLAVIPSRDQYVFAVNARTGLRTFEDIAVQHPALRIGVRGDRSHSLHFMLDDIMYAAGFTRDDITAWGGEFHYEGTAPDPASPKFRAFIDGSLDAIFEEGADSWIGAALEAGMTILSLGHAHVGDVGGPRLPAAPSSRDRATRAYRRMRERSTSAAGHYSFMPRHPTTTWCASAMRWPRAWNAFRGKRTARSRSPHVRQRR